jgi:hypothetical protein
MAEARPLTKQTRRVRHHSYETVIIRPAWLMLANTRGGGQRRPRGRSGQCHLVPRSLQLRVEGRRIEGVCGSRQCLALCEFECDRGANCEHRECDHLR